MSKHTPGPWNNQKPVIICNQDDAGLQISYVNTGNPLRRQEGRANAFLIAAAPELLKALERISRPHDCGCVPCTGSCTSQYALQITVDEIRDIASAAIAKAKGEQP